MEKIPDQPTPEEIEKIERSRVDSHHEFRKGGADDAWDEKNKKYHEPFRLEITDEQLTEMQKRNEDEEYRRVMEMIEDNKVEVGKGCILRKKTGEVLQIEKITAIGPHSLKIAIELRDGPSSPPLKPSEVPGGPNYERWHVSSSPDSYDTSYYVNKPGDFKDNWYRGTAIEHRAKMLEKIYDKEKDNREGNKKLVEKGLQKPHFLEIPFSDIEYVTRSEKKGDTEKLWYDRPKPKEDNQS